MIKELRTCVANHQCFTKIWSDGQLTIDVTTASMILTIYDALNEKNQAEAAKLLTTSKVSFRDTVDTFWKHLR